MTKRDHIVNFLERRCAALCLDDGADRAALADQLLDGQVLVPDADALAQAIQRSLTAVYDLSGADLRQMARNSAQAVLALLSEP